MYIFYKSKGDTSIFKGDTSSTSFFFKGDTSNTIYPEDKQVVVEAPLGYKH